MNWTVSGQCLDVILSSILVLRLVRLRLHLRYMALLCFVLADGITSLVFIPFRMLRPFDYRIFSVGIVIITTCTTIWMVYSLLSAMLEQLPGIRRFCFWFLNVVFLAWVAVSVLFVRPEWTAYQAGRAPSALSKLTTLSQMLGRAFTMAEILIIVSTLLFVLRFPIRMPKNLAAFSAALSIYLLFQTGFLLLITYVASMKNLVSIRAIPAFVTCGCLVYWIRTVNPAGEEAQVTLGRGWQSVPKEHLVRQLEALNAALLGSSQQT